MWIGINGQIAMTIDASYYKGCGSRENAEREIVYWVNDETSVMKRNSDSDQEEEHGMDWCIGNGQVHQLYLSEKVGALNCMMDQQKVLRGEYNMNNEETVGRVRRLTPTECERLQGFPDGFTDIGEWTDTKGKKHQTVDSNRYKALGNSIALPFWFVLLRRISAQYDRPATLGSLFDGIGGFPLCWERCNGTGTAIWASEIEEFPIAVTKLHFPEPQKDEE